MQELEGSEAERERDRLGELLPGAGEQGSDAGVEGNLPAEGAHYQRRGKVAVFGREIRGEMRVEEFVAMAFAGANTGEDLEGGETS
jgi:hypothetical protein